MGISIMPGVTPNIISSSTMDKPCTETEMGAARPRFYIVRPEPNKKFVPLVAVDELPTLCRLQGVPLTLSAQVIEEWNMARVGDFTPYKGQYEILLRPELHGSRVGPQVSPQPHAASVDENKNGVQSPEAAASSSMPTQVQSPQSSGPLSNLKEQMQVAMKDVVDKAAWEKGNDPSKTKDAMTPGVYGKKKYCTHWIRTGNCDYVQEGCKYLHVIPDEGTRMQIGIRDMPRWAKEDLAPAIPPPPPPPPPPPSQVTARLRAGQDIHGKGKKRGTPGSKTSIKSGSSKQSTTVHTAQQAPQQAASRAGLGSKHPQQQQTSNSSSHTSGQVHAYPPRPVADAQNASLKGSRRTSNVSTSASESFRRQTMSGSNHLQSPAPNAQIQQQIKILSPSSNAFPRLATTPAHAVVNTGGINALSGQYSPPPEVLSSPSKPAAGPFLKRVNQTPPTSSPYQTPAYHPAPQMQDYTAFARSHPQNEPHPLSFLQSTIPYLNQAPNYHIAAEAMQQSMPPPHFQNTTMGSSPPTTPTLTPEAPYHFSNGTRNPGTIGDGRPVSAFQTPLQPQPQQQKPLSEFPVHRRLFVAPGEEQYIVAQPEEKPKRKRSAQQIGGPKGRGEGAYDSDNLISLDTEGTSDV